MRASDGGGGGGSCGVVRKMRLNCGLVLWMAVWIVTLQLLVATVVDGIYVVEKVVGNPLLNSARHSGPNRTDGMWSSLLEEYTLGLNTSSRQSRVTCSPPPVGIGQTHQYIPASSSTSTNGSVKPSKWD
uniref:Uncharacterized protein n=1 Tax=Aedes albopictus TaxID=7160 RepID=A0A023EDM1_AEDAL